jgi:flagellar motor switch protein FliG
MSDLMTTSEAAGEPMRMLNGPEKVAALLLSVDKFVAQRVLKHFDQSELRQITKFAAGLGSISASTIEPLIEDFMDRLSSGSSDIRATPGEAEQLLTGVIPPEQIAEIMSDVLGSPNSLVWERLAEAPEASFSTYVSKEHPQTVALILSKVNSTCAAKTLGALPAAFRDSVLRRMLSSRPVSDETLRLVEGVLQQDILMNAEVAAAASKSAKLAAIINKMERDQAEGVLRSLAETNPTEAQALKELLFTFEDIVKLNIRARMILFDTVPSDRVVMALRGAEPAIQEFVLSALSSRMRRMVESELAAGSAPPKRDVMAARRAIAETVLRLAEQGKIDISDSAEAEA